MIAEATLPSLRNEQNRSPSLPPDGGRWAVTREFVVVPEYAEIFLNEFSEYDLASLREGVVFYWSIGRIRKEHGQVIKFSELRLRPTPRISKAAQRRIAERARNLDGVFRRSGVQPLPGE